MTAVKICGLAHATHALAAAEAGAAMIGCVFAPSRRRVTLEQARALRAAIDAVPNRPELVGLFVNAEPIDMLRTMQACGLDLIQLSGTEPLSILSYLPGVRILKTVRLNGAPDEQAWLAPGAHHDHVRLLVDGHVAGSFGGTGVAADWARAAAVARQWPIMLAGGLTPENVGAAIRQVRPWGVDVSSGVEVEGVKDTDRIRAFLEAVRRAAYSRYNGE